VNLLITKNKMLIWLNA